MPGAPARRRAVGGELPADGPERQALRAQLAHPGDDGLFVGVLNEVHAVGVEAVPERDVASRLLASRSLDLQGARGPLADEVLLKLREPGRRTTALSWPDHERLGIAAVTT